MDTTVHL